ncbi:MAG: hypothetical protein IKC93_04960, partial [Candidatus Methanomethylophilaceae archaeon]|nr:hypothetical protein [Candidatus Methanomethylophilaceae archaeon]
GEIVPNKTRSETPDATLRFSGLSKAITGLSERIGLTRTLKVTFGQRWADILSCAMYGLTGNTDLSSIEGWSAIYDTPSGRVLKKDDVNELLEYIGDEDILAFQKIWRKRVKGDKHFHMSISPSMSYDHRDFSPKTEYGRLDAMPTMDMDIIFGQESQLPICYELLPSKVMSLEDIIRSEERYYWVNTPEMEYVLNEDYCTGNNVNVLVVSDRRFTIRLPSNHLITKNTIEELQNEIMTYANYKRSKGGYSFIKTQMLEVSGKPCYVHLYYSAEEAEKEMAVFLNIIEKCRVELMTNHPVTSHTELYGKYFDISGSDMEVELNSTSIMETTKFAGMTVILSDCVVDPLKAVDLFTLNTFVERTFDNIFNKSDHLGLKLFLRHNFVARYFIQFVTLILRSAIRKCLIDNSMYRDYTVEDVVRGISRITTVTMSDRKRPIMTSMDYNQELFLKALDVEL